MNCVRFFISNLQNLEIFYHFCVVRNLAFAKPMKHAWTEEDVALLHKHARRILNTPFAINLDVLRRIPLDDNHLAILNSVEFGNWLTVRDFARWKRVCKETFNFHRTVCDVVIGGTVSHLNWQKWLGEVKEVSVVKLCTGVNATHYLASQTFRSATWELWSRFSRPIIVPRYVTYVKCRSTHNAAQTQDLNLNSWFPLEDFTRIVETPECTFTFRKDALDVKLYEVMLRPFCFDKVSKISVCFTEERQAYWCVWFERFGPFPNVTHLTLRRMALVNDDPVLISDAFPNLTSLELDNVRFGFHSDLSLAMDRWRVFKCPIKVVNISEPYSDDDA